MMDKINGKVFLLEPFEETKYKKIIVYSDTSDNARMAANQKFHAHHQHDLAISQEKFVYLNPNFSQCSEIIPKMISVDDKLNLLTIEYEGVRYKLVKDKPEVHIGGGWIL